VSGVRTILVSADLRRPSVHRYFGLQNAVGVVDAVLPDVPLERLLQANELPDLRLLAAGRIPPNPAEILGSSRFAEILDTLSAAADLVIIDSPPLLGVADASALASRVDGVLLVVNPAEVNRRTLAHAEAQLRKAGGRLLGVLLNAAGPSMSYGYGYGYGYYSAEEKETRKARKHRRRTDGPSRRDAGKAMPEPSVSGLLRSGEGTQPVTPASRNGHGSGAVSNPTANGNRDGSPGLDVSSGNIERSGER